MGEEDWMNLYGQAMDRMLSMEELAAQGMRASDEPRDINWRVNHSTEPVLHGPKHKALSKRSTKDIADELIKRHPELEPIKDQLIEADDYDA